MNNHSMTSASIAMTGGIVPIIFEYINLDTVRIYLLISILMITASWTTKFLR